MSAPICNAANREELGCDADDGLPCAACEAAFAKEAAYWAGQWAVASAEERDPARSIYESGDVSGQRYVSRVPVRPRLEPCSGA